jgi:hypothetical protein
MDKLSINVTVGGTCDKLRALARRYGLKNPPGRRRRPIYMSFHVRISTRTGLMMGYYLGVHFIHPKLIKLSLFEGGEKIRSGYFAEGGTCDKFRGR